MAKKRYSSEQIGPLRQTRIIRSHDFIPFPFGWTSVDMAALLDPTLAGP